MAVFERLTLVSKNPFYMDLVSKMIENDMNISFIEMTNLKYDATIVEGVVKISQTLSSLKFFPHLLNRQFEMAFDNPDLRYIFRTIDDICDFGRFFMQNLIQNARPLRHNSDSNSDSKVNSNSANLNDISSPNSLCDYSAILTHKKLTQYYEKHLKTVTEFQIQISRISENFVGVPGGLSQKQWENGLDIHRKLIQHFKNQYTANACSDKSIGVYGLFLKPDDRKTSVNDMAYVGSHNFIVSIENSKFKRVGSYSTEIVKVFKSGHLNHNRTYHLHPLFAKIVEADKAIEYMTIPDLRYDPKIIEGAVKIAQIAKNHNAFENLVNRRFETQFDKPNLRYIFKTIDDICDFAMFIVENMVNNVHSEHLKVLKSGDQQCAFATDRVYKCLVKGCGKIYKGENIHHHIRKSKDPEHVKVVKFLNAKMRGLKGKTMYASIIEEVDSNTKSTAFKHARGGKGVGKIKIKCKHCKFHTTYGNFVKHHLKRKHPKIFENVIVEEHFKCKYQNECIWPDGHDWSKHE